MVKQPLSSVYEIKRIIDGPKMMDQNGKKTRFFKVRWQDTFEPVFNLPKAEVDKFMNKKKNRAKILGPIADDDSENLKDMNFAVEFDNNVHIYPYSKVKADYKDELIDYYERCARPQTTSTDDSTSVASGSNASTSA